MKLFATSPLVARRRSLGFTTNAASTTPITKAATPTQYKRMGQKPWSLLSRWFSPDKVMTPAKTADSRVKANDALLSTLPVQSTNALCTSPRASNRLVVSHAGSQYPFPTPMAGSTCCRPALSRVLPHRRAHVVRLSGERDLVPHRLVDLVGDMQAVAVTHVLNFAAMFGAAPMLIKSLSPRTPPRVMSASPVSMPILCLNGQKPKSFH